MAARPGRHRVAPGVTARQESLSQHAPIAVCAALALALAAGTVAPLRQLLAPAQLPLPPPSTATAAGDAVPLRAVLDARLFGSAPRPGPAGEPAPTDGPLVLAGIIALPDPSHGLAIVGATVQGALAYAVGSRLPGDYVLAAVFPDRVILARDGTERTLYLPHADLGALLGGAQVAQATPPEAAADPQREDEVQRDPLYLMAAGEWTFGGLNPRPRLRAGRLVGVVLSPEGGDAAALARRAGLRPGDVLTAIDGQPLASLGGLPGQLRALEGRQSQLTVQHRSGETAVVVVSLPKLEHDDG